MKTSSADVVWRVMSWVTCARRTLSIEELQEAVAFDRTDKNWDADKIPNGDKIIRSCLGLVIRDEGVRSVRFAHHTVRQYLLSEKKDSNDWNWSVFTLDKAESLAGEVCATYLMFSDFETAVAKVEQKRSRILLAHSEAAVLWQYLPP